ncbi:HAD hydrolase-like protein [Bradyrhizobium sp. WSM1743]|uniref:HAD hydrolase-like protein n=1 Tax=Bradyrhizobium sp. WSM1743 TaxID=318996 RepID=UPI0003FD61B7|nr:HAD hydrolase-like protein [Bradyrhizobium sp. WSM1743]
MPCTIGLVGQLATHGARIDAFEYGTFHPDGRVERYRRASERRKPQPGMIIDFLGKFPVDASRSFLVDDQPSDIQAARAAGLPGHVFPGRQSAGFYPAAPGERIAS